MEGIDWQKTDDGGFTAQYLDYELTTSENVLDGYFLYTVKYFGVVVATNSGYVSRIAQQKAERAMKKHIADESKKGPLANCVRVEETIPTPLEWGDVAHLYQEISAIVECEDHEPQEISFWPGKTSFHADKPVVVKITPVLRHLDDMTQEDARAIGLTGDWFTTSSLGSIVRGNTTEREKLFGDPHAWVWALNEGFDMFKLIERGLAIRKEATNG